MTECMRCLSCALAGIAALTLSTARGLGRIGVRDEEYEPLVIDWRARAAEPFYRATPVNPMPTMRVASRAAPAHTTKANE